VVTLGGVVGVGIRWGARRTRASAEAAQTGAAPHAGAVAAPPPPEPEVTVDLRDPGWGERVTTSPQATALYEELRARRARDEAARELGRLRTRHWSPERIIEEGRVGIEFWEHHEADPYAVLSLLPGASLEEAAAARRRIAQECHPDRLAADRDPEEALRRMVAANAAYDRLRRALRPV
jgi:hypothetical protein